jgi:hypothetical protein
VDTGQVPNNVFVQGQYAYITNDTNQSGTKKLEIFDISNPASPTSVGSYSINGAGDTPMGVFVQGRYAYVANFSANIIHILNVSTPATPTLVGAIPTSAGPVYPYVQGRFLYIPAYTDNKLQAFDISGGYIQQFEIGGLEAGSMDIQTNLTVNNGLTVSGGIHAGIGGIFSAGALAISASHANALSIAPFGTSAGNTGEFRFMELSVNGTNYVGFKSPDSITANTIWALPNGDAPSTQALSTNGAGALSWATFSTSTDPWSSVAGGMYYASGYVGIGTSTAPTALLTLTGGGIALDWTPQKGRRNSRVPLGNTITMVDNLSGVLYTSIVLGVDGRPIISYYDNLNSDLKVIACGNAACDSSNNTITTIDSTGDVGLYSSIAIGSDGFPVISYYDSTNGDLKIAKCGNATCSSGNTLTSVATTDTVGFYSSITIGTDGFPVISYYGWVGANFYLKIAKCGNATCSSGNTLTDIENEGTLNVTGTRSSIAIGIDGLPVVAYYDPLHAFPSFLKCGNTACSAGNMTMAIDTAGGQYASLTIGLDGLPIISHYNDVAQDLKIVKCGAIDCNSGNNAVTLDSTGSVGAFTAITMPANGNPIISYYDSTNAKLKILICGNSNCTAGNTTAFPDTSVSNTGSHTSIAIGAHGLPIISYQDAGNGDLKVAACGSEYCINYWTKR